jgi:uncharacterized protein (DUF2147 family)
VPFDADERVSAWRLDMGYALRGAAIAVLFAGLALPATAGDPTGMWLTQGGKSRVRIANCGRALCGTIAWLNEPNDPQTGHPKTDKHNADPSQRNRPLIGVAIMLAMKPTGTPDTWSGQVYNAEDGKTYSGSMRLQSANALKLEGCALGGLICKGQTWTRVN